MGGGRHSSHIGWACGAQPEHEVSTPRKVFAAQTPANEPSAVRRIRHSGGNATQGFVKRKNCCELVAGRVTELVEVTRLVQR
jgi:hypothetical protein